MYLISRQLKCSLFFFTIHSSTLTSIGPFHSSYNAQLSERQPNFYTESQHTAVTFAANKMIINVFMCKPRASFREYNSGKLQMGYG